MAFRTVSSLFTALTLSALSATADVFTFTQAGLRAGVDLESQINLTSYEVFGTLSSPWDWQLTDHITADLTFEAALGALTGEGETAGYIHFGPSLVVSFGDFPVKLVISSGPSLYSEDIFDTYNIGGNVQFTSSIGLNWQACEDWSVGYRLQHTSNAGLDSLNPGLDMHALSIAYRY
jgi:hypothetical protein